MIPHSRSCAKVLASKNLDHNLSARVPMVVFRPHRNVREGPRKKIVLTVLNTSEMAVGDSDDTSVKLGVTRGVKRNAGATDGLGSYSDSSRHRAVSSIRNDADTCAECSKQYNNDCRNALKYQFTPQTS